MSTTPRTGCCRAWRAVRGKTAYHYDHDGVRIARREYDPNGQSWDLAKITRFLVDKQQPFVHSQVIAEFEDDGDGQNPPTATLTDDALTKRFTYGDDLVTEETGLDATPATRYFHTDGQLSTRQLTDAAGTVDNTDYRYDAFGEDLANTGLPVAQWPKLDLAKITRFLVDKQQPFAHHRSPRPPLHRRALRRREWAVSPASTAV